MEFVDNMVPSKTSETITQTFAKSGSWALLSLIMLCGIGWKANQVIDAYLAYVNENAKAVAQLSGAIASVKVTEEKQLNSLITLQETHKTRQAEHTDMEAQLFKLVTLMEEAKDLMKNVPEQRKTEIALSKTQIEKLQQIQDGIERLNLRQEASESTPN